MKIKKLDKKIKFGEWFWKEGKYVDFWNIQHFLFGALIFCVLFPIEIDLIYSFIILLIFKISWEIFENNKIIHETLINSILDVVSGVAGFFVSFYLIEAYEFLFIFYFPFLVMLFILIGSWGINHLDRDKKIK